jgi:ethanolamine ammonia-lyase large subunit
MGVPGADDVMLNYQSTSFHDALYLRQVLGLRRAPEFETGSSAWDWLTRTAGCCLRARSSRCCSRREQLLERA